MKNSRDKKRRAKHTDSPPELYRLFYTYNKKCYSKGENGTAKFAQGSCPFHVGRRFLVSIYATFKGVLRIPGFTCPYTAT
jgi:hypothetical protein